LPFFNIKEEEKNIDFPLEVEETPKNEDSRYSDGNNIFDNTIIALKEGRINLKGDEIIIVN
jgi:hypothetical protein